MNVGRNNSQVDLIVRCESTCICIYENTEDIFCEYCKTWCRGELLQQILQITCAKLVLLFTLCTIDLSVVGYTRQAICVSCEQQLQQLVAWFFIVKNNLNL
eukprot:TRINITY_DN25229_c0_g1_i3.p2 TRINITY_DN25229_c0_g1~~TRINITY_DN25229_c0_g1_i3.p2  ORF type:complete len:101 (+),score=3.71 TRINITY_DN25229_c0_g1_i3:207-509(+)